MKPGLVCVVGNRNSSANPSTRDARDKTEIAFVDPNVAHREILAKAWRDNVEAIVLDPTRSADEQICAVLESCSDVKAIHILAHGCPGEIGFAAGPLSTAALDRWSPALDKMKASLGADGQVLLWSCNAGAGESGNALVEALSEKISASVFASSGFVGASDQGGSWNLDFGADVRPVAPPITSSGMGSYPGLLAPPPPSLTVIELSGSMSLLTDGTHYFLQPNGGAAVELSYNGAPVFAGEFAQYGYNAPIAAAQTANGYEVAWKTTSGDQYQIWLTDSSGNETSIPFVGSGAQVESYEASFNDDLNGDGTIGVPPPPSPTVIESSGSMSLLTDGTHYFLQPNGGAAVELSYNGAPVFAGEFAQYRYNAPIAAAQTANGYEVAWKTTSGDQYQIWLTDSSGNETSIPFVGSGAQVELYEASFNDDLNGDGTIGVPPPPSPTVIESSGSMSLLTDGTHYFLQPNGGAAVELSYNGAPVFAGEFAQYRYNAPIAAAQTANGYEVAWKTTSGDQYQIWLTDSSGNETSIPFVGSGAQVESYEASFNDDLNGDGTIGVPPPPSPTVIESSGSMSLLTDGTNYFLQPNGGAAVELSYNGAPVFAGEFAQDGYNAPIAAAQTANGYEVAWKTTSGDQYQIWLTDSSGNETSIPFVGSGAQVELYETSFNDDLNGDGTIGVPPLSPPQFVYQGTDATGAQVYDITNASGLEPFAVRVLTPEHPSTVYPHSFLYDLPVEPGLAQSTWGSGLNELQKLDVEDLYNATIIEPIFPIDPWYADNPNDPTINYETFVADILPQWVDSNFSTTGTEKNLLVGFSKSGYGGLDLELKHPSVFSAVAAFDFPADMSSYDDYGSSSANDYGTQANFQENYQLSDSFINALKTPFTTQDRLLISEGPVFQSQVADFGALLTSQGVAHTLLTQTNDAHNWSSGWLSDAIAGLYGLEKNLNSGASA